MKITAITRYKHGELYAILKRIGWTQSELARRAGIHVVTVGDIINLVKRPTAEQADAIQMALGTAGEYFDVLAEWPEAFRGVKRGYRREQTAEVPMERLIDHPEIMQLPVPETVNTEGLYSALESAIETLPPRAKSVLKNRFWENKTFKQTGKEHNVGRQQARNIENAALRRLRHPSRMMKLTPFIARCIES